MWLGLGLSLDEFLKLDTNERRRRFCELSDVHQILFVERHLDPFIALLQGFPTESFLPELPPPGYRSPNGAVIVFPANWHGASPETSQ
jgi:hypothetical protein